jgi:hypothetical protein
MLPPNVVIFRPMVCPVLHAIMRFSGATSNFLPHHDCCDCIFGPRIEWNPD